MLGRRAFGVLGRGDLMLQLFDAHAPQKNEVIYYLHTYVRLRAIVAPFLVVVDLFALVAISGTSKIFCIS